MSTRRATSVIPPQETVRGRSGAPHETISCSFAQIENEDTPDVGPITIKLDGTVDAFRAR
ncbi:MAG TPA: hypothetical protein VGK55_00540 [Actinomycetes bacterium]